MNEQKKKNPNFSTHEEGVLLSLVEKYWNVVESKKTDAETWNEKRKTWDRISKEFIMLSGVYRETKNLRMKYDNLKKKAKRDLSLENNFADGEEKVIKDIQFDKKTLQRMTELNGLNRENNKSGIIDDDTSLENVETLYVDGGKKRQRLDEPLHELMDDSETDSLLINMRKLVKIQKEFYKNEEKRAKEKHTWEKEEKDAKLKLLNLEIEIKSKQLENM